MVMPKKDREGQATVLTREQWGEVWTELDQPYRLATQIAYYCAERMGAVVQLSADDIGATHIRFKGVTTKTGEMKQSRITPALRNAIAAAEISSDGFIFPGSGAAGHLTTRAVEKWLKRAAGLLGHEGVSNHSPRRSRCTHLDEAGWSLEKISKVSGHKSLASLEKYIDRDRREAEADLMELDAV
ncbi:tyrosine-type recombinase/integrase [Okeania sp. SIO2G5]|uniref:tyrosine-type recombinase/integrase n=1 Tax=Okeania sp. SIO2G5 TaxID=2607796 RepID=UPI00339067E0